MSTINQVSTASASHCVLEINQLQVRYQLQHGKTIRALNGVDLVIKPGEVVGVVGESGSGKSTLGLASMALLPSTAQPSVEGSLRVGGQDIRSLKASELRKLRGQTIAMIFQDSMVSLHPQLTVSQQIVEVLEKISGANDTGHKKRAVELLGQVGIAGPSRVAKAYPHELSGGMRQRVMIAMAIAGEPALLIADEPTTALDVTVAAQIVELLLELRQRLNMAMLYITHDLALLAGIADRIVVMYGGRIVEQGPVQMLYDNPRHPYTRALLGAILRMDRPTQQLRPIPGSPIDPSALPPGCAFADRCTECIPRCRLEIPALNTVGLHHDTACWNALPDAQGLPT